MKQIALIVLAVAMTVISNTVPASDVQQQTTPLINVGAESSKENGQMTTGELDVRGKQLRNAIDERYKKLADAGAIKSMGNGRNYISDVVTKYIPIGTSFGEAEVILRAAGFKVGPRGSNPVFPNLFEVVAVIDQYVPTLFGNTRIYVSLEPASSNDWRFVKKITAEITRQFV